VLETTNDIQYLLPIMLGAVLLSPPGRAAAAFFHRTLHTSRHAILIGRGVLRLRVGPRAVLMVSKTVGDRFNISLYGPGPPGAVTRPSHSP
jgi:hypothetical protein